METSKRVFSEQEVAEIIRRAAELQEHSSDRQADYRLGVTRDELERAAQEVGVAPEFLKQAIEEKLAGVRPRRGFAIAPEEERVVEGEIDPKDFDLILEHLPVRASRRHPVTQVGHYMSLRARNGIGIAGVDIHSRNGRTRIRVKPIPIFEAILTFYPAFLATMIAAAPLAEAGQGLLSALIATLAWGGAIFGFLGLTRKARHNASRLADTLVTAVSEEIAAVDRSRIASATKPSEESVRDRIRTQE